MERRTRRNKKESKTTIKTMTKENNTTMTTTINESVNETLKEFQSILVKICEDTSKQQMSTININMDNIMKATLLEQQLN